VVQQARPNASVSQRLEEAALEAVCRGFESHSAHFDGKRDAVKCT
jgi:hypothetical protein